MIERDAITGARTMWELVDRRATASGDRPMLIDAAGTVLTFGAFRDRAEAVAAGLAARGVEPGTVVSWQLPTRIDSIVLSIALSRLGAVQNPIIHLYREREVGFALRQTGSRLFAGAPGVAGHRLRRPRRPGPRRRPRRHAPGHPRRRRRPARGRSGHPPTTAGRDRGRRRPDPLDLLTPLAAPPTPRASGTPTRRSSPVGSGLAAALDMSSDDVGSIAFPFAHIAGPDYLVTMLALGFPAILVEAFSVPDVLPLFRRHGATMVGGSTAFYVAYLAEQRKQPDQPILPSLRLMSGGGAPKPPEVHSEVRDEIGGRGVVHGYGMTEVPMIANGSPHDTDEQLANTDGRPGRRRRRPHRPGRRRRRRPRRRG